MHPLLLLPLLSCLSGSIDASDVITGPAGVRGPEGGSLAVQCRYAPGWETYVKYWCHGATWSNCQTLVKTTGSQEEVKRPRVSIKDNRTNRTITVTMEKLRRRDAGTYWCAIERTGNDHKFLVQVTVGPATTTVPTPTPTTVTTITTFTVPVTTEATMGARTVTSLPQDGGSGHSTVFRLLVPLLSALLLLLLLAAATLLVWRRVAHQSGAAETPPEQVLQPLETDLCYANLTLQRHQGTPSSPRKKGSAKPSSDLEDQAEVEYVTMAALPKEDVSYAALSLDALDQDAIYINTGDPTFPRANHLPSGSAEAPTEYSAIRTV